MNGLYTIAVAKDEFINGQFDATLKALRKYKKRGDVVSIERSKWHDNLLGGCSLMYFVVECSNTTFNKIVEEINGIRIW